MRTSKAARSDWSNDAAIPKGPTGLEFDPARQVLSASPRELRELAGFPDRSPMIAKVGAELHAELGIIDPEKQIDVLVGI
ncbi:hypothetical protein CQ14_25985 [Bradyrhizobium lablabi]|uniref:Uncharacterized protein n=1 Tax=Bradyrhizobium lablabi TaxID=722472 RepID=A0A0R3MBL1_9BRAD|nr:hypothetical protein CQ14_25985 [Bradyrhizobium lablabi]